MAAVFTEPIVSAQIITGGMPLWVKCDPWVFDPKAEKDHQLITVLEVACRYGNGQPGCPALVDFILKRSPAESAFYHSMNAQRALMDACWLGNLKCAHMLLREGVLSLMAPSEQQYMVQKAIEKRFSQIVFAMSRCGFDVKEQWPAENSRAQGDDVRSVLMRGSGKGKSTLMLAALYGLPGLVKFCLDQGAELEMEDAESETALTLAARGYVRRSVYHIRGSCLRDVLLGSHTASRRNAKATWMMPLTIPRSGVRRARTPGLITDRLLSF